MAGSFETGLEGKPWWVSALVAAALAIGIIFLAKVTQYDQMQRDIQRAENRYAELEKKINEAKAAQRSLPQFEEVTRNLSLELEKLLRVLPSRRNTEELLRNVRTLAEQGNFDLLRFTPRRQSAREFYYEWPIQIRVEGDYHNLALFFDRASRFSRIINVEDLDLRPLGGEGTNHTVSATFTLKTYLYIEPAEGEETT